MSVVTPIAAAIVSQVAARAAERRLALESRVNLTEPRERAMADTVQEFFANLESKADSSKTAGMSNSYVFDVEDAGQWMVDVDDGKVTVTEGGGDADVVISTSRDTFEKIVTGDVNPTSAYMTGKLKIKGDMGAAMKLQKLF
jgi:putative sterol carrier protein